MRSRPRPPRRMSSQPFIKLKLRIRTPPHSNPRYIKRPPPFFYFRSEETGFIRAHLKTPGNDKGQRVVRDRGLHIRGELPSRQPTNMRSLSFIEPKRGTLKLCALRYLVGTLANVRHVASSAHSGNQIMLRMSKRGVPIPIR